MRIVLVLDPPAQPDAAADFLRQALSQGSPTVVTLPAIDPMARALAKGFEEHEPGEAGFVVLARAGAGRLSQEDWDELGLAEKAKRLQPVEDPAVEAAIAEGAQHLESGNLEQAHRSYAFADSLLSWEHGPRRAEVLVCLASIEAERGSPEQAASLLDRALAIFPDHQTALKRRIELAQGSADGATAAALRRRLLRRADTDEERASLLSSIADESLHATTESLERALELRPKDPRLLERLQASLEAAGRWREAVDTKVALTETIESPRDRARSFTAAAGMCARRTQDVARAVALYEAAIADDPSTPGAFEAIEAVLIKNADFSGVALAYERQLERLAGRGQTEAECGLLDRLANVHVEHLGDVHTAILTLDRLVKLDPENVEARARLAALLEQTNEPELAARCLANSATWGPTRAATFRELHRITAGLGDLDRSYAACAVLVHLGEADQSEQEVYRRFAPETTPRPQAALESRGWAELHVSEHDDVVSHLVHAIAPAAIDFRMEQLRTANLLPDLSHAERHDVEKTTLTAVRTVAWACAVLGLDVPAVYAQKEDLPGGIVALPLEQPTILLGESLLSGRSVPELAFTIARALSAQHLTQRLLTFYPSPQDFKLLLLAAIAQVLPSSLPSNAIALRDLLAAKLGEEQQKEVEQAVEALQARDGRFDLTAWTRAIEMAACRAGLLACGDITAAARMLAVDGRVIGGLSAAGRIRDLIPFSVSEKYAGLRRGIGIGVTE